MTLLAAFVTLVLWQTPPTADFVMAYSATQPQCVRPVLTDGHPWCRRAPDGCDPEDVDTQSFETSDVLAGPVVLEHEELAPGEVLYILMFPIRGCWAYDTRLEVR